MSRRTIATRVVSELAEQARQLWTEAEQIREVVIQQMDSSLERAWRLGQVLTRLKVEIGAGNWLLWLDSNLPQISERTAQRHMVLDSDNPEAQAVTDLSADSVRKFRLGYVPAKERALLDGDQPVEPATHHLTILNDWRKMQRRVAIGQATIDPERARRDLQPLYDWLRELYSTGDQAAIG